MTITPMRADRIHFCGSMKDRFLQRNGQCVISKKDFVRQVRFGIYSLDPSPLFSWEAVLESSQTVETRFYGNSFSILRFLTR